MGGHDPGGEAGSIKGSSQGRSKTSLPERSSEDLRNAFAGMDVHFQVKGGVLSVCGITEYKNN